MATMTITTTAGQDTRLVAAFTDLLQPMDGNGDPRNATAAEIKTRVIEGIRSVVHNFETREAAEAAADAIVPIEPT
jgi:hypothetical protein